MIKTLRKALKLLPPAFAMRIWLERRYSITVPPAPGGMFSQFAFALLPYAITAALSVRVETDRRLAKYFLPYGRMKRFVRLAYGMKVGDDSVDHGFTGFLRAFMPYGLVLWWDNEGMDRRTAGARLSPFLKRPAAMNAAERDAELRGLMERVDKLEAMISRLLVVAGASGE